MSLQLLPSTVQDQLVQEMRLPLWLGRTLALSSEQQATCKRHIEYKDADGRIQQLQVDLAFSANSRTITRLMEAWWGCKGGRPPGSSKRAAAALAGTSKPRFKAMPVSFNNAVEKVMYLEAELLSALKEVNAQQLALKERQPHVVSSQQVDQRRAVRHNQRSVPGAAGCTGPAGHSSAPVHGLAPG
ncbi:hypothetical protein OEZ86_007651 [Tetradesmus obliquus]|nr:hypothetical protein OEZ86_007651 [Tetradesmus obliquus]